MNFKTKHQGFTLLEILLVVGIISILAGIVIVAINPSKQLASVRNTERKSDIKQIDSAILQYYIDNFRYPTGITSDLKGICNTGALSTTTDSGIDCGTLVDLTSLVPTYITSIPTDPQSTTTNTGYYVKEDATTHKLGTRAELAELSQDININAASGTPVVVGGGGCDATGGTETTVGDYKIHTFTDVGSDTFTVNSGSCDVEVLVVAGGGAGGGYSYYNPGGGGGAGGVYHVQSTTISGEKSVIVGAGGVANFGNHNNGYDSSFGNYTASGGGAGGAGQNNDAVDANASGDGVAGGSGGGGQGWSPVGVGGSGTQGHAGADGYYDLDQPIAAGGGGGGAGEAGHVGVLTGGNGGEGVDYSANFGTAVGVNGWFAGGGGGSAYYVEGGLGGQGGGGNGHYANDYAAENGVDNTGGGGGSACWPGNGGSGVVIVKYAI